MRIDERRKPWSPANFKILMQNILFSQFANEQSSRNPAMNTT